MNLQPHLQNIFGMLAYELEYELLKYNKKEYLRSTYKKQFEHFSYSSLNHPTVCETWAEATIKDREYRLKGLPIKLRQ